MLRDCVYLTAVVDVFSRRILSNRLAITMEPIQAKEILKEAMARYRIPEIGNIDQGSQFTGQDIVDTVPDAGASLSIDGRGALRDNVFVRRAWRSIKYDCLYLKAYDSVSQVRYNTARYTDWCNSEQDYSSLDDQTQIRLGWPAKSRGCC